MNKHLHSQSYLRKRKMLLVLPLIVLPFITLAFWALWGGKASDAGSNQTNPEQGLNLHLPDARLKEDKGLNKLSYYEIAAADSAKLKDLMRNDPYFKVQNISPDSNPEDLIDDTTTGFFTGKDLVKQKEGLNNSPYSQKGMSDPNEEKILRKLNQLNEVLDNTGAESASHNHKQANFPAARQPKEEIEGIERNMLSTPQIENAGDPEMNQINGMLDKIMDIQHPDRIKERTSNIPLHINSRCFR